MFHVFSDVVVHSDKSSIKSFLKHCGCNLRGCRKHNMALVPGVLDYHKCILWIPFSSKTLVQTWKSIWNSKCTFRNQTVEKLTYSNLLHRTCRSNSIKVESRRASCKFGSCQFTEQYFQDVENSWHLDMVYFSFRAAELDRGRKFAYLLNVEANSGICDVKFNRVA